jgi:hypothetical protein
MIRIRSRWLKRTTADRANERKVKLGKGRSPPAGEASLIVVHETGSANHGDGFSSNSHLRFEIYDLRFAAC